MLPLLALLAQAPSLRSCPNATTFADAMARGWSAYRLDSIVLATRAFTVADSLCPRHPDAQLGLSFILLRQGRSQDAEARFTKIVALEPNAADGWYGLGLARARRGEPTAAVAALRTALRLAPSYGDAADQLLAMGVDSGLALPARPLPLTAQVPARTAGEQFEVQTPTGWQPLYVKGVNLGAALPGRFPSDFPADDSTYARWLALMAQANANVVRLYTIFPPAFYRALSRWNELHSDHPLWLVQGVWAELPPRNDFDARAWNDALRAEARHAADVVHGHALIAEHPGHAWGRYQADVADHVLAFLVGREWEPFSIGAFDRKHRSRQAYRGRFLAIDGGTAADAWLAELCDYVLSYEWDTYRAQRPIGYTNWPPLDPLHHPTEASRSEEAALRRRYGYPPNPRPKEYDNDVESLDAANVRTTPADLGGYFVAYHAYPYYPDFVDLDPEYGTARSAEGPSHYFGYLLALKRHYPGRPLLIAEYGVPSSRGISHLQPEGMNHGGHDEREMAEIDGRLTREIHEAGLAGGIVFSWLDEWFKHTWVTIDLEQPADRTRLWHNVLDAEQSYGLLGEYAGDSATPEPGGDPGRWRALRALERGGPVALRVGADPSYLYLALEGPLDSLRYVVGIDTYGHQRGETTLPGLPFASDVGFEFALMVSDTSDAQLKVVPWYNPYLGPRSGEGPTALDAFYNQAATVEVGRAEGGWDSLFVATNRWRISRTGQTYPARGVNPGRLRYGRAADESLADWYVDRAAGLVEIRLAWGLLNVTDPSSHRILRRIGPHETFETTPTDGVRVAVAGIGRQTGAVRVWIPATTTYRWPTWETPVWHERLKPAYAALRDVWGQW